jgi:parvulin-like peptidyl-prolyl isomerase
LRRKLKRNVILIIVSSVVLVVAAALIYFFVFYNKTLATVDGMEVKQKEVDVYMNFIESQSTDGELTGSEEELKALEANIIDSLIVIKLLEKYAEENNITVSSQEISERMETVISSYASEEEFEENLESIGINRSFLEGELKGQLLRKKIYDEVTTEKTITDEDAKQYYDDNKEVSYLIPARVKASHILAVFPWIESGSEETEEGRDEALKKIEMVEDRLKIGGDFEELAKQYSDDEMTAGNGGDLGYISKGQTVAEFEEALFSLDEGQISQIIETEYGFHIIKIYDHQEEYYQDFEEVKESIKIYLLDLHKLEEYNDFIFSLIEEVDIEYFIDMESTLE